jgi:hypothetical protein
MIPLLVCLSFSPGERLEYVGKFSFINLGSMTLQVIDTVVHDDQLCYHFSSILNSNPGLRFLFSLNDTIDVLSRADSLLPLLYEERKHEGSYEIHSQMVFDHNGLTVTYDDTLQCDLEASSRDLVSFWYYLRTVPLYVGETVFVNIHASKDNYVIPCYVEKEELIHTACGEFNTVLVRPQTEEKGIFGSGGGMDIWYDLDEPHYPVQIKAKTKSGSVLFKIKEISH